MGEVTDLAERAWSGKVAESQVHPGTIYVGLEAYSKRMAFMSAFSNVLALDTDGGLVLIDTSSRIHSDSMYDCVRKWTKSQLHTAVYTHGHVDHVFGTYRFEKEAKKEDHPRPVVIAHENCPPRFDRYRLTNGYNAFINQRQFQLPAPIFPMEYRYPDKVFREQMALEVGATRIWLFHDKGETDDHVWAWIPSESAIYTGDLFIWASPNCGNPQKAQRYPREWAKGLRKMAELRPDSLFPGHGPPILGEARVQQALAETAELLETICDQTLKLMNEGAKLNDILHSVTAPQRLLERPYLRPIYDEPEFVVRNLWRLYGGWYDGNPANLKPSREDELAREIATLAGGAMKLVERAQKLSQDGNDRLACHLVETAFQAAPTDPEVLKARANIYDARGARETSVMAKGVFAQAARKSRGEQW